MEARNRLQAALALAGYLFLSLFFFGLRILPDLSGSYLGFGVDPTTFIWYLEWWPHALTEGLNPLHTALLWAPQGVDLAGGNGIPALGLLAWPLTAAFGPVASFNVLVLLAPALSAWTAYLLARHLTRAFWPSLVAGYLFGFSTYVLGRMLGHLNLGTVALLPLAVLLVVRRLEGDLPWRRFALLLGLVVLGQLLISPEIALTMVLFGGLTLLAGAALSPAEERRRVWSALGGVAAAVGGASLVLSPFLIGTIRTGLAESPIYDFYPAFYSTDLLNFVVPTGLTRLGRTEFAEVSAAFTGNLAEQVAYVGLPLLAVTALFLASRRRDRWVQAVTAVLAVLLVATLGPVLHVAGAETVALPWRAVLSVPLLEYALPGRFMLYVFLIVAVAAGLWLAEANRRPWARWALVLAGVLLLLPNTEATVWTTEVQTPAFFANGTYREHLVPGETVVVVPYGDRGASMLWQAQADLSFRMAGGYVNVVPPERFSAWPILHSLYTGDLVDGHAEHLRAFLGAHEVRSVIVADGYPGSWGELFAVLGEPERVGGVSLYRVPEEVLSAYAGARPPST